MNKSRDYRHLSNMLRENYPEVIAMTDIPHEAYMAAQALDELMDYIQSIEATPPAAQRKPLTDAQISKIRKELSERGQEFDSSKDFARAIEAAHGIKENT